MRAKSTESSREVPRERFVNVSGGSILAIIKQKVYIETSIVSYLTSRRSRDMVIAAHQELTLQWWEQRAGVFALAISELVREEVGGGDSAASSERLGAIEDLPILAISDEAVSLAGSWLGPALSQFRLRLMRFISPLRR
jgi:hypothetical protein